MTVEVKQIEVDVLALRRKMLDELESEERRLSQKAEDVNEHGSRVVSVVAEDHCATRDGSG